MDCKNEIPPHPPLALCWAPSRLARALQVEQMTLLMMTETQRDGLRVLKSPLHYYGSDPYDTYRATTALMRWGRADLSAEILGRQLGRRCPDGTWQMWETDPVASTQPTTPLYIVQGLASEAVYEQFRFTKNMSWLATAYPALAGTANATVALRKRCACAGLMPKSGGDGGLPVGHVFVQEAGALFGLQCASQAAAALGDTAAARRFEAEFEDFRAALLRAEGANYDEQNGVVGMTASDGTVRPAHGKANTPCAPLSHSRDRLHSYRQRCTTISP